MPEYSSISWNDQALEYAGEFGLNPKDVETIVRTSSKGELDPYTHKVGHLVVKYRAGDVTVVVGYREKQHPRILWVRVNTGADDFKYHSSPGGVSGSTLPRSDRDLRRRIMEKGYKITPDNHPKVIDVETDQVIMTMAGTASDHRTLANTWRAFVRIHAENVAKKKGVEIKR